MFKWKHQFVHTDKCICAIYETHCISYAPHSKLSCTAHYSHDEKQYYVAENLMLHANITALYFIEPELLPIEVLKCRNGNFRLLWPWPWPDDLIWTWPAFPGDTPHVLIWTSYIKAFESYRLTDTYIQTRPKLYTTPLRVWSTTWLVDTLWFYVSFWFTSRSRCVLLTVRTSDLWLRRCRFNSRPFHFI